MANELSEQTKEAKSIVDKIKKLMYNCDLTLAWAYGEIRLHEATMKLYEGDMKRKSQQKYVDAKINKERLEIFAADIEHTKQETTDNLNLILDKYQPKYRDVFRMFFLEDKTYQDIADTTNYSFEAIKWIIRKLRNDLITLYLP